LRKHNPAHREEAKHHLPPKQNTPKQFSGSVPAGRLVPQEKTSATEVEIVKQFGEEAVQQEQRRRASAQQEQRRRASADIRYLTLLEFLERVEVICESGQIKVDPQPQEGDEPPETVPVEDGSDEIVLELEIPEDAPDLAVLQGITGLVDALDDLHRAHGGNGLKIDDPTFECEVPVPTEVPA